MRRNATPDWDDVFLGAALEPGRWLDALDTMAVHTGATHGQLIGIGPARDIPFNLVSNFAPADLEASRGGDASSPEGNFRIAANARHMAQGHYDPLLHERHYDEVLPTLRSRRYVDWCDLIDIPFGCQTNLVVDSGGIIGFATLRSRADGRTTPAQRRVFARAAAAARRAVRLQERIEGEQTRLVAGMFDAIGAIAFLLDGRGRMLALTAGAEALLAAGDLRLRERMLEAAAIPWSLQHMSAALTADTGVRHMRVSVVLPPDRPPLFLEGFRLPDLRWSLGGLPRAIIVAKAAQRDRAGVAQFLRLLYAFTPAESDIATRLYEGRSRAEIAAGRMVTPETLRGQIKQIYLKTASQKEADLIRLLAAIMA